MNLHSLKPALGSTKRSKRIGRGQGSGKGGTSTKGHKGAQSRSGYKRKLGFEGGQMPLYRLLPKRGFKNINRIEYSAMNLETIQALADKTKSKEITIELMRAHGLLQKKDLVKILGKGEVTSKLKVTAHAFSKSAIAAIEKAGGSIILFNVPKNVEVETTPEEKKQPEVKVVQPEIKEEPKIDEPQAKVEVKQPETKEEPKETETSSEE